MSSTNIFLSFSVFLNLVLLALFWANVSNSGKDSADLKVANSKVSQLETDLKTKLDELALLQTTIGITRPQIGTTDDNEVGTTVGDTNKMMAEVGGKVISGQNTLEGALRKQKAELDNQKIEVAAKQKSLDDKSVAYDKLVAETESTVKLYQDAKVKAEQQVETMTKEHGEEISKKDVLIAEKQTELDTVQTTLEKERSDHANEIAALGERLSTQANAIRKLKKEKFEREDVSFEVADGRIIFVDQNRGVVTIDRGRADGLRVGTTFSVYQKDNTGIGRRNLEDIKAKIQVIALHGSRQAEARILDPKDAVKRRADEGSDDYYGRATRYQQGKLLRPIAINDPIYSPTFTRGEVAYFSLVGMVDLDGDGKSDRGRLRNLITSSGGQVDNEVGDDGEFITQNPISYKTKFLVIGDLGDQAKILDAKQQAALKKINEARLQLQEDAEDNGIRIVSLNSFLNYMGYQPTQSPWVKGEDYQTTLSAGAQSDTTSSSRGRSDSQGNVSAVHDVNKRRIYNLNDRIGRRGTTGDVSPLYKKP